MPTTAPPRQSRPIEPAAQPTRAPIAMAATVTPIRIPPAPAGSKVWRGRGSIHPDHINARSDLVTARSGLDRRFWGDFVCFARAREHARRGAAVRPRARQRRERTEHLVVAVAARGALHARRPGPPRLAAEPAGRAGR